MLNPLSSKSGASKVVVILGILVVLVGAAGLGTLMGIYYPNGLARVKQIYQPPFGGRKTVRLLVLGEDNTGGNKTKPRGLSDTIMLVNVDLESNRVSALSIPRDTRVDLGTYGECKINATHVIGGPGMTEAVVEELTGIHPDYYIKTSVPGFKKCVDILGGVEIDVEKNMNYDDNWGHLHIHLKKGKQLLNGEQAVGYVRFRHDALGDITRMQRQQKFLKALAKRALEPANLPRLPRLIAAMHENVTTDLTTRDLLELARLPKKINMDDVQTETLPGACQNIGGVSFYIADTEKIPEVVAKIFFAPAPGLPTVEVLNGSGIAGAAQKVAEILREQGYQVVNVTNAESYNYETSEIICHKSGLTGVEAISRIVGSRSVTEEESASSADVTLIVGRDYASSLTGG
jgi:LCP family protein required for cell wall assembly